MSLMLMRAIATGVGACVLLAAPLAAQRRGVPPRPAVPPAAAEATVPSGSVPLVARHSGKCIDAAVDPSVLVPASQQTCRDTATQRWIFQPVSRGAYRILSAADERFCLNLRGATPAQGARVWLSACSASGQPGEIWTAHAAADGAMTLVARHSARCMGVSQQSLADGAAILQYTCYGGRNEMWTTSPVAPRAVVSVLTSMRPRPIAHVEHDGLNFSIALDNGDPGTLAVVIPEKSEAFAGSSRPAVRLLVRMESGEAVEGAAAPNPPYFSNGGEVAVRYRFPLGRPARDEEIRSITIWIGDRRYTVFPF